MIINYRQHITLIVAAAAVLWLISPTVGVCAPTDYLGHVQAAIGALETGRTGDCVRSSQDAFACNANDPLAHVTLGLALLCGKRPDDAMGEFDKALVLNKACASAMYGKALVHLSEKRYDYAASAFGQAQVKSKALDTRAELAYIESLKSGTYALDPDAGSSPLKLSMNAIWLMSQNRQKEARQVWETVLSATKTASYRERPGCGVTFLRSAPVAIGGSALTNYSDMVPAKKPASPVLTGTITLRADLSKAQSVKMVLFFVDGNLVGITNRPPFQYPLDTTRIANGPHILKIQGSDGDGMALSEKSTQVIVQNNGGAAPSAVVTGEEADKLWARLWNTMQLKASLAAINYNLAVCALEERDEDAAKAALERVMAANPDYLDAGDRLARLYKPTGLPEKLYTVKTDKKIIALTFDDGPKAKTTALLDLLDKKNVKVTFFAVGKMAVVEPDICKRMVSSGHELANHTYNHQDLEYLSTRDICQELFSNYALLRSITGKESRFMRPPGAHAGERLPGVLKKFGITNVLWSANCTKFEGTTANKMADYVVKSARPGGIILMHNLEGVTLSALPIVIDTLTARGYRFVTLSELTSGG